MKNLEKLELFKNHLKNKKDFRVIFDGDDFGIYKYNEETNRYEGFIGYLTLEGMLEAINTEDYFIKLEIA